MWRLAKRRQGEVNEPGPGQYRLAFEGLVGIPFSDGNRIDVLRNGCRIFPEMLKAIDEAQSGIQFLTFIYWQGDIAVRFADALAARAKAGVEVQVLLDSFGSAPMARSLVEKMEEAGVEVRWFRPLANWKVWAADNRTHRKILVVDGKVGFTGGVGIAEEWEGDARNEREWRDTHFRIFGPAVHGLQAAFYSNWMESGGWVTNAWKDIASLDDAGEAGIQVIRSTAAVGWTDIALLMRCIVTLAQKRLRIVTPYLAPDEVSTRMLIEALDRGVKIDIVIPGPFTDKRVSELAGADQLTDLLNAGVKVWRYQPTMIHTKVAILDGKVAVVGSANFNQRSMLKDDEIALVTDHAATVEKLEQHFEDDLEHCKRLKLHSWRNRGILRRSMEAASRLVKQQV
ncbi:MAG: cardiolipin synthase B [Rhodospirillales bacterium]|nr:cardiolipin synthase B [Rhodospirillales bacterium]